MLSRLLPGSGTAGRPRSDDRVVLNGIVWKLRTGSAWRDVPERYGSWSTATVRLSAMPESGDHGTTVSTILPWMWPCAARVWALPASDSG